MSKRENKGRLHREGDTDRGKGKKKGEREGMTEMKRKRGEKV